MRCPKCHYLSFDPEPRCKNCGNGLSLDEPDLLIRESEAAEEDEPLRDVTFRGADAGQFATSAATAVLAAPPQPAVLKPVAPASAGAPLARVPDEPKPRAPRPEPPRAAPTTELPLFVKALTAAEPADADTAAEPPLVAVSPEPRAPLSVRRKAAETAPASRPQAASVPARKLGPLDRDLLEDLQRIEKLERKEAAAEARAAALAALPADRAGAGRRLAAAAIDAGFLGGLSAAVLWVTLRWSDLPVERITVLPAAPTLAFLLIVGLGYLLMFTAAGGQTIGKMALGLRVVSDLDASDASRALSFKQAFYRELLAVPSVLMLGTGFIPGLLGEGRALHDRLTHTRVVRA